MGKGSPRYPEQSGAMHFFSFARTALKMVKLAKGALIYLFVLPGSAWNGDGILRTFG